LSLRSVIKRAAGYIAFQTWVVIYCFNEKLMQ